MEDDFENNDEESALVCPCGYQGANANEMEAHYQSCEYIYSCEIDDCDHTSVTDAELRAHYAESHPGYEVVSDEDIGSVTEDWKSGQDPKPYPCICCDPAKNFATEEELMKHKRANPISKPEDLDESEELGTGCFVAFVRYGLQKVLLVQRNDSDSDYPLMWDGVYGFGSTESEVLERIHHITGIPVSDMAVSKQNKQNGAGSSRTIYPNGVRLEITPLLVIAKSDEVELGSSYTAFEWIDPGDMYNYYCAYNDPEQGETDRLLHDMYGSLNSFVNIVKTAIGGEKRVVDDMHARLSGAKSLTSVRDEVFSVMQATDLRGYLFVEGSAQHHVEKLIGRTGGRDRKTRGPILSTPLKNAKGVLNGDAPLRDILPYLEPKAATSGIEVGCIVEIINGAFKSEKARVIAVSDTKEEVSMELYEQPIPMTLTMRADHVRVIERVE